MPSLGPAEILVVLVVALLVFGPNKMPEIARQVGKGFREFRRVQQHLKSELRDVVSEFDSPTTTPDVEQQAVPMLPPKDDAAVPDPPTDDPPTDDPPPTDPPPAPAVEATAPLPSAESDVPSEPA
jgi:sec-independent protein translocase protein TatA